MSHGNTFINFLALEVENIFKLQIKNNLKSIPVLKFTFGRAADFLNLICKTNRIKKKDDYEKYHSTGPCANSSFWVEH